MTPPTAPPRRADARENAERIVLAAVACLGRDPRASMSEIARAAGVGRVTLYGHFSSREELVEAALRRVLDDGETVLRELDLSGDPRHALQRLIESSWLLVARAGAVLEAAQASLPPGRVQELHGKPAERVTTLIRRGQEERLFRTDLPVDWLTEALHHLMKGAAVDVAKGRRAEAEVPGLLCRTVLAAYAPAPGAGHSLPDPSRARR